MDMCFFRPKFALINQVSFPPGNKMRYDMLKEHGNTNMFLHDLDGFFYLYQQRFLTTLRDSLLNMCKPWIVNICGVLVMKLNSRETRANKIMHWNRFETWVTEYFLKRGKATSPFCDSFFWQRKGAFSIKYDLARSCFQSFSKMEANLKSNLQFVHLG